MNKAIAVNIHTEGCDTSVMRGPNYAHMNNTAVHEKGWLGNPYPIQRYLRSECIELFRRDFHQRLAQDAAFKIAVHRLKGKRLGCCCKPEACHADVIAEYLNGLDN